MRLSWRAAWRARAHAPIALQLVVLLLVSLAAAQVATFLVLALTPPPVRPVYSLQEVAQALRGGALATRYGRTLERIVRDSPPQGETWTPPFDRTRQELAAQLGVPEADVRLIRRAPSPGLAVRWALRTGDPIAAAGPRRDFVIQSGRVDIVRGVPASADGPAFVINGGPPPPDAAFVVGQGTGPREARLFLGEAPRAGQARFFTDVARPLFGDFAAALRQADGRWLVVRPTPERFPTEWQRRLLLWFGASLLVVAPLGYVFARRITAPLGDFARAAEALGRDPRSPQLALSGPAEVGKAARAFNGMQARLKRYVEDRTRMVGAISHDLRTPLARIRFKMENAPPALRERVLSDVEQMEEMIASVLSFIRDDSAARPRQRIDLMSVLECQADDAAAQGQDVQVAKGPQLAVDADLLGMQRLFGNLISNAVKYGDRARISLSSCEDEAVVRIADDGPGLPPSELERVFEPFYRAEAARTLDGSGVGLGLAVARSIARGHGGDVSLASSERGLVATVRLPLSAG